MESLTVASSPLKGKNFSCLETSIKLSPCPSSVRALAASSLYGKVIAPMSVDIPTVLEFVAKTWKRPVSVIVLEDDLKTSNVFKFGFDNTEDRNWAISNGPWCIRGYTLALQDWSPRVDGPILFNSLRVWVQVHNLPHEFYSKDNGLLLGGLVGKVLNLEMVEDKPASWSTFFKILVDLDINKPLVSGCFFDLNSGVKQWLQMKYEKIGIFCYNCGRLGHQRRGCSLSSPVTVSKGDGIPFPMFGPWLSTSSAYHDVFSGPVYGGSSSASLVLSGKNGGAFRPAMASPAMVEGRSKGIPALDRRPRNTLRMTSRAAAVPGKAPRLVWHPKPSDVNRESSLPVYGNGDRSDALGNKKDGLALTSLGEGVGSGKFKHNIKVNLNKRAVGLSVLDVGPLPIGPNEVLNGKEMDSVEGGPHGHFNQLDGPNSDCAHFSSGGPVLGEFLNSHDGPMGNPNLTLLPNLSGPAHMDKVMGDQSGPNSSNLLVEYVKQPPINEEQALSQFFKAQEDLMKDLKHFGKLDLYEIRKIGGDIGVPASSEVNERTTPFKKRKFESFASLFSRPHKIHRKYPGVVRDFPWDTKQKENVSDQAFEEPSEDSSNSPSHSGILKNPLIGSFVIDDAVSSGSAYSHTPVEENVESPPQEP
uniref:CCHC-type domain-containing protein n=1 Tax=Cannabis sativa TaxID=3483 RepID=A0A803Q1J5_CANSA